MASTRMRRLVVDGSAYLWSTRHQHPPSGECREVFTAYLAARRVAPLRILFTSGDELRCGDPQRGVVWVPGPPAAPGAPRPPAFSANLNTPSVAASLVRAARARGWDAEAGRSPFVIDDGLRLLLDPDDPGATA